MYYLELITFIENLCFVFEFISKYLLNFLYLFTVLILLSIINWYKNIELTTMKNNFTYFYESDLDYFYIKKDNHKDYNHAPLDLPWPASDKMNSLVILYLEVCYTVLFIFLVVSVVLLETLINYSSGDQKKLFSKGIEEEIEESSYFNTYPSHFSPEEEHLIDMFVIIIPTIIVLQIIIPTLGYLYNEELLYFDSYISFDVNIIGNQWFWTYEYVIDVCATENITEWNSDYLYTEKDQILIVFDSVIKMDNVEKRLLDVDNPLVLPVNTNVLFSFTSRDVIHSWALPQMGIKVDCIPGRITHTVFSSFSTGIFYGQCSELCGPLHGFMPICVEVVSFDNFFIWVMIKYKNSLNDLGIYTDLIYTNEVFSVLNINNNNKTDLLSKLN